MNIDKDKELERPSAAMLACVYTMIDAARMAEVVNGYAMAVSDGMSSILHCSGEMAATCDNLGGIMWDLATHKELGADDRETIKKCRGRVDGWITAIKEWDPDKFLLFPDGPVDNETEAEENTERGSDAGDTEKTDAEVVRDIADISRQIGVFEKDIDALIFGDLGSMTPAEMKDALENGLYFLSSLYEDLPGYPGDDDAMKELKIEIWSTKEALKKNRATNELTSDELDAMLDRLSYLNGLLYTDGQEEPGADAGEDVCLGERPALNGNLKADIKAYTNVIGRLAAEIAELEPGRVEDAIDCIDSAYTVVYDKYCDLYEKRFGKLPPAEQERISYNRAAQDAAENGLPFK